MLVKNEFGVWQIDLTVGGQRVRKSTRTKDKGLAEKLHALTEADLLKGSWGLSKPKLTLEAAFRLALKSHWRGTKNEQKVADNWKLIVQHLDGSLDVTKLTAEHIRDLVVALAHAGNSPATINRKMAVIRKLLNLCIEWGKLGFAPKIRSLKEPPSRHRELSVREEAAMIAFFAEHYPEVSGLFEFLLSSASRLSEALKLEWSDIDFDKRALWLIDTKSGESLYKPFTETIKAVLGARRHLPKPFPYTVDMTEHYWAQFRRHLGLQGDSTFVIHSLRHTCASRLVAQGVDLKRIQMWLGHKSYSTTLKYAQLQEAHLQGVVAALNSGKQFDYSLTYEGPKVAQGGKPVDSRSDNKQQLSKARVVKLVDTRDLKSK